ncbi:MAG TPA: tetratricopeptide repeat protein [Gemmatimonadales bacterium]|nr:tetratricopeptide repeat protein [Gemmatimonadales bacterium]
MATGTGKVVVAASEEHPVVQAIVSWVKGHRQASSYGAAAIVFGVGLLYWMHLSSARTEAVASDELLRARVAYESKNYPLAASELSRVIENYSGTRSAQEGQILEAQVRLAQGQSQQAIDLLKTFAPSASKNYRAQAYGLLGAAYENVAHPKEAAEAYEQASGVAGMDFLKAQYLSDAGRAWVAAADTAKALADYRRIVKEFKETGTATEAKVRLGELSRGAEVVEAQAS